MKCKQQHNPAEILESGSVRQHTQLEKLNVPGDQLIAYIMAFGASARNRWESIRGLCNFVGIFHMTTHKGTFTGAFDSINVRKPQWV